MYTEVDLDNTIRMSIEDLNVTLRAMRNRGI